MSERPDLEAAEAEAREHERRQDLADSQKPTPAQRWKMNWMDKQEAQPPTRETWKAVVAEEWEGRPDPDFLAGISELAQRYDVQPNTVAVWTQRHADFPEPLIQVGGRVRVWWVPDVDQWMKTRS